MQKKNRILMASVSILLCFVLLSNSLLSAIFARFAVRDSVQMDVGFKQWGITITDANNTLVETHDKDGNKVFEANGDILQDGLLAPGTRGQLLYFHIEGTPEVDYILDFQGKIDIGYGFWSSKMMIEKETYVKNEIRMKNPDFTEDAVNAEYTRLLKLKNQLKFYDEIGRETEYLPIQLKICKYDLDENNTAIGSPVLRGLCATRLSPDAPLDATVFHEDNPDYDNPDYDKYRWRFHDNYASATVYDLEDEANAENYWNDAFHANVFTSANTTVNSVYAVEWEWVYHYPTEDELLSGLYQYERLEGANGDYQTADLDTQLGEAVAKCVTEYPEFFNINLNMSVLIEQVRPYTRNGNKITFGSYPQSEVTEDALKTTLNGLVESGDQWDSYNGKYYIDVVNGADKYRGVNITASTSGVTWFKFEPIAWTIIKKSDDGKKALLFADVNLDYRFYQDDCEGVFNASDGVPDGTYANNYEYSTIRKWLNDTFYDTAFNELQSLFICVTNVDNSAASTGKEPNEFACSNTDDKVFLISVLESNLETVILKKADTAYAGKIKGSGISSVNWWTRSPSTSNSNYGGRVTTRNESSYPNPEPVSAVRGVAPALWLELID